MEVQNEKIKCYVSITVVSVLALALSWKPLSDVDLGWHLAEGLLLTNGSPLWGPDTLGSGDEYWWNYSWLFQIILGYVFNGGGFDALWVVQSLFISISVYLLFAYSLRIYSKNEQVNPFSSPRPVVATIALLPFLAPMWHLRPQLLSISFFILLLILDNRRFLARFVLALLWANIHVFWLFAPLIQASAYFNRDARRSAVFISTAALTTVGLFTPFGFQTYRGLFEYAFAHSVAYDLIKEFQPFTMQMGLLFWYSLCVIVASLWQLLRQREHIPRDAIFLGVLFCGAAFIQIKYLPYAAISLLPILLAHKEQLSLQLNYEFHWKRKLMVATLFVVGSGLLLKQLLTFPGVDPVRAETIEVAQILVSSDCHAFECRTNEASCERRKPMRHPLRVFTDFNDGGWFALGFVLATGDINRPRTVIDGRTLVMGSDRLTAYRELLKMTDQWKETFSTWDVSAVAVRDSFPLAELIRSKGKPLGFCEIQGPKNWVLLRR